MRKGLSRNLRAINQFEDQLGTNRARRIVLRINLHKKVKIGNMLAPQRKERDWQSFEQIRKFVEGVYLFIIQLSFKQYDTRCVNLRRRVTRWVFVKYS